MLKRIIIGIILLTLVLNSVVAQGYAFQSYGVNEGLQHPFIECVALDSMGYTWVGTSEGLYVYDGNYFDGFRHSLDDTTSISDNLINTQYVDPNKEVLWVGTRFGGVSKLNLRTFKSEQIQRPVDEWHKNGIGTVQVIYRHKRWLLIGTEDDGLQAYNLDTEEFIDFKCREHRVGCNVLDLKQKNGVLYVATNRGLYFYSLENLDKQAFELNELPIAKEQKRIHSLSFIDDSILLACSSSKLIQYEINTKHTTLVYEKAQGQAMLTTHIIDEYDNIWLGTYGEGLIKLNLEGDVQSRYTVQNTDGLLANNWISALCYSPNHQLLWVGTKDGLSKYIKNKLRFKQVKTQRQEGRMTDNVFFLFKDSKDHYWWWTHTKLYFKDGETDSQVFTLTNSKGMNKDTVNCGYEDRNETLWMGTFEGLLAVDLNKQSYTRTCFEHKGANYRNLNIIYAILPWDDSLWVFSRDGVIHYLEDDDYRVYLYPDEFKNHNGLKATTAHIDNHGIMWIGDKDGALTSFNPETKQFAHYSSAVTNELGKVRRNAVMDLHIQSDSTILMATYGMGLLKFNTNSKQFGQVLDSELLSTNIYSIHEDEQGFLWMNNNSRVIRYDERTNSILSFGRYDGIMCREFNQTSHFQGEDGTILMGGFGGFVEFKPSEFRYNTRAPEVDLGSYSIYNDREIIGGQVYRNWEYIGGDTLIVSTEDAPISFYASVFNYQNSYRNLVTWQLEGHQSTWDTLMSFNAKVFQSIPEGKYRLRVKACNNDQVWNNEGDSIVLIVKPGFIDSRLFKGIIGLIIVVIILVFYRLRIRYLNRQKRNLEAKVEDRTRRLQQANHALEESREEILSQKSELERHRYYLEDLVKERTVDLESAKLKAEEADRLKTAFLANLSHEIRTPMNSIVGFSTLLASEAYDEAERKEFASVVQKSSDSLLVLINDIIDISRIETGQILLVKKRVDINSICKDAFKSLELSVGKEVKYELDMVNDDRELLVYTDAERLKQIIINLLNNAIKFTSVGRVRLTVREGAQALAMLNGSLDKLQSNEDIVLFAFEDTGIGIPQEQYENIFSPFQKVQNESDVHGGIGLGLSIVKQLVEMLGGKIWLKSAMEKGTTFFFYIPK